MAIISNPLDDYQSYSVHYILLACRTTGVAGNFASEDPTIQRESLQAIENVTRLGDPVRFNGSTNDVFLVMDTRRFSQFTVESLKYDVWVNGLQTGGSTSNLATDLSMVILDSTGVSFANFMQYLLDSQMQTNYDGLIFMLRTIFVGHLPDGTTTTIQSETIPMHLIKMDINLDFAKGSYNLEFMPNMNFDTRRHSRFLTVSTATSYASKDNKLLSIIDSLETALNEKSEKYFKDVQTEIGKQTGRPTGKPLGRLVQYMITIPTKWKDFELSGSNVGGTIETLFKEASKTIKTGQIRNSYASIGPGATITKTLDAIFRQVPEIAKLGNFNTEQITDGSVQFFKYIVGLTSDDTSFVVHVDVVEFIVPNLFANRQSTSQNTVSAQEASWYFTDEKTGKRTPKDFIEWDYIFTGKNKDITNFDMKIEEFQFLLASNVRMGDGVIRQAADAARAGDNIPNKPADEYLYARAYDPMFMPLNSSGELANFSQYNTLGKSTDEGQDIIKKTQLYTKNLSMFYAGSPIVALLTIKGNPDIMHKFNMGKVLPHTNGLAGNLPKEQYRKYLEDQILKTSDSALSATGGGTFKLNRSLSDRSYSTSPVFARVNIMGPNVDYRTGEQIDQSYATSVLTDNFYVIFKVTNNFNGAIFTQDLELYSHNTFGRTKLTKAELQK